MKKYTNIHFAADAHFNHKNIIKYCNRPYTSVEEMNESIVSNWNNKIGKKDLTYVLGDLMWGNFDLNRLNGDKILIIGNHDNLSQCMQYLNEAHFYLELKGILPKGNIIPIMHYPIESWNRKYHGSIHLHGHTHGTLNNTGLLRFDVGVDCWNMSPTCIDEILELVPGRREEAEKKANSVLDRDSGFETLNKTVDKDYKEGEEK